MAFGRPPPPRRALAAATIGAVYALLLLLEPDWRHELFGVVWFLLSVGLLFMQPISYHVFVFWSMLWVVWRGIIDFRAVPLDITQLILDVTPAIAALLLILTSGYLPRAQALQRQE